MTNERSNHSNHGRRHYHRHSSRSSSNYQGHEEETEWRRQHHHRRHGDRHHHEAKPYFPFVKLPSFSGDSDPNVYLGWEAKCEHKDANKISTQISPSNFSKETISPQKVSTQNPSTPKSPTETSKIKCFKCLSFGHITANCPLKKTIMFNAVYGALITTKD